MKSPTRLDDSGDLATQREEPEANSAEFELAIISASPTADLATVAVTYGELGLAI
jgi:hypothetical protein